MTGTKLARIIRFVFLFWLVASIVLVVAMAFTLRPLPDRRRGLGETQSSRIAEMVIEKCVSPLRFHSRSML